MEILEQMGSLSSPASRAFFKEEVKVLGWGLKWWMPGPVKHKLLLLQNSNLFLSVLPGLNYSQLRLPPGAWKESPPQLLIQTLPDVHTWDKKSDGNSTQRSHFALRPVLSRTKARHSRFQPVSAGRTPAARGHQAINLTTKRHPEPCAVISTCLSNGNLQASPRLPLDNSFAGSLRR